MRNFKYKSLKTEFGPSPATEPRSLCFLYMLKFPCASYSGDVQWADGTIAYSAWYRRELFISQCGRMADVTEPIEVDFFCVQKPRAIVHFLCEIHTVLDSETVDSVCLAKDVAGNLSVSGVVCPNAHLTHTFLACDAQSACWAFDSGVLDNHLVPSVEQCPPLNLFSPLFKCTENAQFVPYTFVCNHRRDCFDHSDEDFCVFRPCSGRATIPCSTSSQVSFLTPVSYFSTCLAEWKCVSHENGRHGDRSPLSSVESNG